VRLSGRQDFGKCTDKLGMYLHSFWYTLFRLNDTRQMSYKAPRYPTYRSSIQMSAQYPKPKVAKGTLLRKEECVQGKLIRTFDCRKVPANPIQTARPAAKESANILLRVRAGVRMLHTYHSRGGVLNMLVM
jgi:hypothetical protein